MCVCLLTYLKNYMYKLHKIFYKLLVAVDRFFSDDSAIPYVFPVLCIFLHLLSNLLPIVVVGQSRLSLTVLL